MRAAAGKWNRIISGFGIDQKYPACGRSGCLERHADFERSGRLQCRNGECSLSRAESGLDVVHAVYGRSWEESTEAVEFYLGLKWPDGFMPDAGDDGAAAMPDQDGRDIFQRNLLLEAACEYAELGYPVFPCRLDKKPYTNHGFKDASTDEDQILAWWDKWPDANIGIPTAGFLVLDFDDHKGTIDWPRDDKQRSILFADGPQVKTARGGRHVWRRRPEGKHWNNGTTPHPIVDVRTDGGYVIAPPSVFEGGQYEFFRGLGRLDVPADQVPLVEPWLEAELDALVAKKAKRSDLKSTSERLPTDIDQDEALAICRRCVKYLHGYERFPADRRICLEALVALVEAFLSRRGHEASLASGLVAGFLANLTAAPEGSLEIQSRHDTLLAMGDLMTCMGLHHDEIDAALRVVNEKQCNPPKDLDGEHRNEYQRMLERFSELESGKDLMADMQGALDIQLPVRASEESEYAEKSITITGDEEITLLVRVHPREPVAGKANGELKTKRLVQVFHGERRFVHDNIDVNSERSREKVARTAAKKLGLKDELTDVSDTLIDLADRVDERQEESQACGNDLPGAGNLLSGSGQDDPYAVNYFLDSDATKIYKLISRERERNPDLFWMSQSEPPDYFYSVRLREDEPVRNRRVEHEEFELYYRPSAFGSQGQVYSKSAYTNAAIQIKADIRESGKKHKVHFRRGQDEDAASTSISRMKPATR